MKRLLKLADQNYKIHGVFDMTHGNGLLPTAIGAVITLASLKIVSDVVKDVTKTKKTKKKKDYFLNLDW